jgi:phytoene dehydrogenase-like protein
MEHIYDVIVIGAGISGIAASSILSKADCHHIILESRDRIGGRIYTKKFDGVTIDIGASFVHSPLHNNLIKKIIDDFHWKTQTADY